MIDPGEDLPVSGRYRALYAQINRLKWCIRKLRPAESLNVSTHETLVGSAREALALAEAVPGRVQQFRLVSIQNDFYSCRKWTGTEETGAEVYIARPFTHRVSNFHGLTLAYSSDGDVFQATFDYLSPTKRTKTISGVAETQVLTPLFKTGFDLIYALRCDQPLTAGPNHQPILDPDDEPVTLVEVMGEGRAWTKV